MSTDLGSSNVCGMVGIRRQRPYLKKQELDSRCSPPTTAGPKVLTRLKWTN